METEKTRTFKMPDEREVVVAYEDIDMIFKGYRPRLMDAQDFRFISKLLQKEVRSYKKGRFVHISKMNGMKKGDGRTYVEKN